MLTILKERYKIDHSKIPSTDQMIEINFINEIATLVHQIENEAAVIIAHSKRFQQNVNGLRPNTSHL